MASYDRLCVHVHQAEAGSADASSPRVVKGGRWFVEGNSVWETFVDFRAFLRIFLQLSTFLIWSISFGQLLLPPFIRKH